MEWLLHPDTSEDTRLRRICIQEGGIPLANRLQQIRNRLGWSQTEMANELGLSSRAYQGLEAGERPLRRLHVLAAERILIANESNAGSSLNDNDMRRGNNKHKIIIEPTPSKEKFTDHTVDLSLNDKITRIRAIDNLYGIIDPMAENFDADLIRSISDEFWLDDIEGYIIKPGEFIIGHTKEFIKLPAGSNVKATVLGKSSLARLGLAINSTNITIMPGFQGHISLEITNFGQLPIRLRPGISICQISFELSSILTKDIIESEDSTTESI